MRVETFIRKSLGLKAHMVTVPLFIGFLNTFSSLDNNFHEDQAL